jgi:hypothetical protein
LRRDRLPADQPTSDAFTGFPHVRRQGILTGADKARTMRVLPKLNSNVATAITQNIQSGEARWQTRGAVRTDHIGGYASAHLSQRPSR